MNLQTRLLLGYGYLVSLLVISAISAAVGFHGLAGAITEVVEGRLESVTHATAMLAALERQDSATLAVLLGDGTAARSIAVADRAFETAHAAAVAGADGGEEGVALAELRAAWGEYRARRDELLAETPPERLRAYEERVTPPFQAVRGAVFALLEAHHRAAVDADRAVGDAAARRAALHGLLVAAALLSLGYLSRELRRSILDRLHDLQAVARAVAQGDEHRRAAAGRDDELGVVARQLNAALDARRAVANAMSGQVAERREQLLALLAARDAPAAVLGPGGELVATTLEPWATERVRTAAPALRAADAPAADAAGCVTLGTGDDAVRFRRLASPAGRAVGWLADLPPAPPPKRRARRKA